MTDHNTGPEENGTTDRLAAHERMSTGALARWARRCATHPWRVLGTWLGIIVVLIALVATVGGCLRDEFEIPGSDTQRATDLIEKSFTSEQGAVLNIVFAAPEGERLDTPERKAAIQQAMAKLRSPSSSRRTAMPASTSVGDPFSADTFSKNGRIAYAEAQFDQTIEDADRDAGRRRARTSSARPSSRPGVTVEYNGEAEFPPIEQGTSELLGLLAAIIVLLVVFRTFMAALIPIMLAIVALLTAFLLLFILAGLTDINTVTPILVSMIGLGVGIDYSLFIVTRFRQLLHEGLSPADAAAEAGASAGRAVLFAGLTVAISVTGLAFFGLDFVTKLGIGSALGVLTTVLIANSLLLAVLACSVTRSTGSRCRSCAASTTRRRHARRRSSPAGAGSSPRTRRSSSRCCWLPASCSPARRRSSASAPPTRARSRARRRAAVRTTCWRRASGPASTGRSRSSST